jgi:hypothetical protein
LNQITWNAKPAAPDMKNTDDDASQNTVLEDADWVAEAIRAREDSQTVDDRACRLIGSWGRERYIVAAS